VSQNVNSLILPLKYCFITAYLSWLLSGLHFEAQNSQIWSLWFYVKQLYLKETRQVYESVVGSCSRVQDNIKNNLL